MAFYQAAIIALSDWKCKEAGLWVYGYPLNNLNT